MHRQQGQVNPLDAPFYVTSFECPLTGCPCTAEWSPVSGVLSICAFDPDDPDGEMPTPETDRWCVMATGLTFKQIKSAEAFLRGLGVTYGGPFPVWRVY